MVRERKRVLKNLHFLHIFEALKLEESVRVCYSTFISKYICICLGFLLSLIPPENLKIDHLQNMISQDMNLVLSTDAKPRLKWTPELHQQFVDAVNQLGGPES